MARKLKKREMRTAPADVAARFAGLGPLVPVAGVFGVVLLTVCVMEGLRSHVLGAAEYNPPLKVQFEYLAGSEWVEQEGWLPRIRNSLKLPDARLMDDALLREVASQVQTSGWVRRVERVARGMDGTIRVCCDYRRPIAMVFTDGGKYIPIDKDGVRLPEEYDRVETDSGWMRIVGVRTAPPAVGHAYGEDGKENTDATAAVRLAALLFSQGSLSAEISSIDVSNFNGREDKYKTHIRLWTRTGRMVLWGSAIGSEVEEPGVADKLKNLVIWLQKQPAQASAVDVSVYRNGVVTPVKR